MAGIEVRQGSLGADVVRVLNLRIGTATELRSMERASVYDVVKGETFRETPVGTDPESVIAGAGTGFVAVDDSVLSQWALTVDALIDVAQQTKATSL